MTEGESHHFHTTRWTLVHRVRDRDLRVREEAIGDLLIMYRPAFVGHLLRRHRLTTHDAEECVQDFVVEKVLVNDLLSRADENRGRFRSLMARSLDNFARSWIRRQAACTVDADAADNPPVASGGPDMFDTAWARTLLVVAVQQMRAECQRSANLEEWGLLKHRILVPIFLQQEPASMDSLADRYGLESPAVASNKLVTAKRRLARIVRQLIRESVDEESEVDDEISELFLALRSEPNCQADPDAISDASGWAAVLSSADGERLSLLLDSTRQES